MREIEFDVAIIGCGAYGLPLAVEAKRMGKQAIHMGGATQVLFGIKVNRMHIILKHTRNCLNYWLKVGVKTGKIKICHFIMCSCQASTVRHGHGSVIASAE